MFKAQQNSPFDTSHEGDLARRLAYGLSTFVLFCMLSALALGFVAPGSYRRIVSFLLLTPPALLALALVYRGKLAQACRLALFGIWAAVTVGLVLNGGIQDPLALIYPLLILLAGLLLEMTSIWVLTGLTLMAALALTAANEMNLLFPDQPPPPVWPLPRLLLTTLAATALSARFLVNLRGKSAFQRLEEGQLSRRLGEVATGEGLLRLVVENVPALIHYADTSLCCLFANRPFREFFGLADEPARLRDLGSILGAANLEVLASHAQRALDGEATTVRLHFSSRSHETRSFDCTFLPDRDYTGKVRGYFGQMVDVTDKESADAKLRRSEEMFSRMFHGSPVAIALLDAADGRIMEANEALCGMIGFERTQIVGKTTLEIGVWPDPGEREKWRARVNKDGGYRNQEIRFLDKNHQPRWGLVSSELITLADGPAVLSFLLDVTERKRIEETVAQMNVELERGVRQRTTELEVANRELEAFAYSVSHDLRAPLRSIDGFSHILYTDYGHRLEEEGRDHLRRIRRSAQRLGALIDDLLELSRVSRREMRHEQVDLESMACDIIEELTRGDPQRSVVFRSCRGCDATGPCTATGDPMLLRSLMENLLGNAWKYTSRTAAPIIEFGCRQVVEKREYYVRDNGVGLDMAHAKRLFHPFQRLHHSSQFEGTGIGLATAARIVRRHGGEIRAEGVPGQGATFSFTLG